MKAQYINMRWAVAGGFVLGHLCAPAFKLLPMTVWAQDSLSSATEPASTSWLPGDTAEALLRIEAQLRGLDVAMWEAGYRDTELFHGGMVRNWPYAEYQLEKIGHAIQLGLERRPNRAKSARAFDEEVLPEVTTLVKEHRPEAFRRAMNRLRTGCMECHVAEEVPHFTVNFPDHAVAPIGAVVDVDTVDLP